MAMLIHHSAKDYNVAKSEAARFYRGRMEKQIDGAKASTKGVIEKVMAETPQDAIVKGQVLDFAPNDQGVWIQAGEKARWTVHENAFGQLAERAGVPANYLRELTSSADPWAKELGCHVLREHYRHQGGRYLVRAVNGQARGFLSDKFRRLDCKPLLATFIEACQAIGATPIAATASDLRTSIKVILPLIFEPVVDEPMVFFLEWFNSDYGCGKYTLRSGVDRLACTNLASFEDGLAQVHLGGKLPDEIQFSEATYKKDTETMVSATKDMVASLLGPAKVKQLCATITQANEKGVSWQGAKTKLQRALLKSELEKVDGLFNTTQDVQMLPSGNTAWRMSNAISWLAGQTPDADRKIELERLAGDWLAPGKAA